MGSETLNNNLLRAVGDGDAKQVSALLRQGADANYRVYMTPLMTAAIHDHPDCIELLLEAGAEPNATNQKSETALGYAAELNHTSCVKRLIKAGADVNNANAYGMTPLMQAIRINSLELFEMLIAAGADVDRHGDWTPLTQAVNLKNETLYHRLAELGADVEALRNTDPSLADHLKRYQETCRLKSANRAGATPSSELGL